MSKTPSSENKTIRSTLTTIRNQGPRGTTLSRRSPIADALVEQRLLTTQAEPSGRQRYALTRAGEEWLLDRSDVTSEEERWIAREAIQLHERE